MAEFRITGLLDLLNNLRAIMIIVQPPKNYYTPFLQWVTKLVSSTVIYVKRY